MTNARRARLQVTYNGVDISADLAPYLLSAEYTDHGGGQADDLQLTLHDVAALWSGDWNPEEGATLTAAIITQDWEHAGQLLTLPCGTFTLDTVELNGPPSTVTLKAFSANLAGMRARERSQAWERVRLREIALEIATRAGLPLVWEVDDNPSYQRVDQTRQTDLAFLDGLARKAGCHLKVSGGKIVLYDEAKYEAQPAARAITRGAHDVLGYRFSRRAHAGYTACEVRYHDAGSKTQHSATFEPPKGSKTPKGGQVLIINERAESKADAQKLARKRLRQHNRAVDPCSLSLLGDPRLVAGVPVTVAGWGVYDGHYLIDEARHSISGGYTVGIEAHKALEGY